MHLSTNLDLDVLAHESDDQLCLLVELTAPDQPLDVHRAASTLVVVLDRSGSMSGSRLEQAKSALLTLVDRLDPRDRFGLVSFDHQTTVTVPAGPLADKPAVKRAISQLEAGGSTDLSGGYLRGLQEARRVAGPGGTTVLLISDGHANAGITDPDQLGGLARQAQRQRVTTSTIGMGLGYDEQLLSAVAAGGAGHEHFAETADEAGALIAGEVEGLLRLAAQAASLRVRLGTPVRAVHVLNELGTVGLDDGIMIELGSFHSGETRKLVLTFDVPAIAVLGLTEIASLEFGWVSLPELETHTVTVPVHVNVLPGDQAASRVPDPTVRTEAAYQRAQRAKRTASTAYSRGDAASAAQALADARTLLGSVAGAAPAPLAADLVEELDVIQRLEAEAATGDLTRAAKLSSADVAGKTRSRGRRSA